MASYFAKYLFVLGLLVRTAAGKLAECGSYHRVLYGIVAVDVGCHEGCAKLEIKCPGYKCVCFFKEEGRCMLNVKKTHHFRMKGCERLADSSNQGSKLSQLSNVIAPTPEVSVEPSKEVTEPGPGKGSEKEGEPMASIGVEHTTSVEKEPSAGAEAQPSAISPEKGPGLATSEVPVKLELFHNPELELDVDADHKNQLTPKTKVAKEKGTHEAVGEETRVLNELLSLEEGFDTHLPLGKDLTHDIDIVSQDIVFESLNDEVTIEDMMGDIRKGLRSRKGSKKRSFVDVKDEALNGAEAYEVLNVITSDL